MIEKSIRAMLDSERDTIEKWVNPPPREGPNTWWAKLVEYWLGPYEVLGLAELRQKSRPQCLDILADNHVEIHTLKPLAVARLEQSEDEGESFFFQIAPRLIYVLPYQQGRPDNWEETGWPNTEFDIVRTRKQSIVGFIWIYCRGKQLPIQRELEPSFDLWHLMNRGNVTVGTEFEGTLATLEDCLARHATSEE